jgi:hypothetical protein
MITFYDFDQDHADGGKAYLRESFYVNDFESLLVSDDTSLEKLFTSDIAELVRSTPPIPPTDLCATTYTTIPRGVGAFESLETGYAFGQQTNLNCMLDVLERNTLFLPPESGGTCGTTANPAGPNNIGCYMGGLIRIATFRQWDWTQDRRLAVHRPRGWVPGAWPPTEKGGARATNDPNWANYVTALEAMYGYTADTNGGQTCSRYGSPGRCFQQNAPSTNPSQDGPYFTSEASLGTDFVQGVILRSTEQGTGPPRFPKAGWIGCQDSCSSGLTPAGVVCSMGTYTCNGQWSGPTQGFSNGGSLGTTCGATDTRCDPSNSQFSYTDSSGNNVDHLRPGSATAHWVGCGFRYPNQAPFAANSPILTSYLPNKTYSTSAYFNYPPLCVNSQLPPRNISMITYGAAYPLIDGLDQTNNPGLYDDNVACIMDCPRTAVRDDCAHRMRNELGPVSTARALSTRTDVC